MVDNLYSLVEVVLGASFLFWGLALLIHVKSAQAALDFLLEDRLSPVFIYLLASMLLPWGLAVVWIHNEWVFDFPVIVTLIGWVWTGKCFLWLTAPEQMKQIFKSVQPFLKKPLFIRGYGVFVAILGGLILLSYVNVTL